MITLNHTKYYKTYRYYSHRKSGADKPTPLVKFLMIAKTPFDKESNNRPKLENLGRLLFLGQAFLQKGLWGMGQSPIYNKIPHTTADNTLPILSCMATVASSS